MTTLAQIQRKWQAVGHRMDERTTRIWAATEAREIGRGGTSLVARATGLSRTTIQTGLMELEQGVSLDGRGVAELHRVRRPGGGRKTIEHRCPDFAQQLEHLVEPLTRGDPESPLRWTCKSTRQLADELKKHKINAGRQSVATQLHRLGYRLQGNQKTQEGQQHPGRNAQFEHINLQAALALASDFPVISVDTKKKELLGNYKNNGRQWHAKGQGPRVQTHDFPDPDVPRAYPCGLYDLGRTEGVVNVGTDHDTPAFAVASIRAWWKKKGHRMYRKSDYIQIMCDSGGSNGDRRRTWKWELQQLADEAKRPIRVCHFPPGTSKWNKVEHRLFSFISQDWRGEPLQNYETIVKLISSTTTRTGLNVHCELDLGSYPLKQKIADEDWATINLHPDAFHGEWNYEIRPRKL